MLMPLPPQDSCAKWPFDKRWLALEKMAHDAIRDHQNRNRVPVRGPACGSRLSLQV